MGIRLDLCVDCKKRTTGEEFEVNYMEDTKDSHFLASSNGSIYLTDNEVNQIRLECQSRFHEMKQSTLKDKPSHNRLNISSEHYEDYLRENQKILRRYLNSVENQQNPSKDQPSLLNVLYTSS